MSIFPTYDSMQPYLEMLEKDIITAASYITNRDSNTWIRCIEQTEKQIMDIKNRYNEQKRN